MSENEKPKGPPLKLKVLLLVISLGMASCIMEIGVRTLTRTDEYGQQYVSRFRLLPNAPTEAERKAILEFEASEGGYQRFDPMTGWSLRPGGGGDGVQANAQGIRVVKDRVFTREVPAGKFRVVTVGDSFTHGDEVAGEETWQHYLEVNDEKLEAVNLGMPGYGMDQAFLRWREFKDQLDADLVLLGVWPEDICRNLNIVRFYLAPALSGSKPRFILDGDGLKVVNQPVATGAQLQALFEKPGESPLYEHERWWQEGDTDWRWWYGSRALRTFATAIWMLNRKSMREDMYTGNDPSALDLSVAISEQFLTETKAAGAAFAVVLLPMRSLVDDLGPDWEFPLKKRLQEAGVEVIDLWPGMRAAMGQDLDAYMPRGRHYTPRGNELVARVLHEALQERVAAKPAAPPAPPASDEEKDEAAAP